MRMRLSTRLILSVVLIEALMLGTLVWNSVRLISSSHAKILEQTIHRENLLLATSLAQGLAFQDRALLLDVLSLLHGDRHLSYVQVFNRNGDLMAELNKPPANTPFRLDQSYQDALHDGIFDTEYAITLAGQTLGKMRVGYTISGIKALTRATRLQNTGIAGLALFFTVGLTILLGLFLTGNLRRLEEGAHALMQNNLHHRIPIESKDEIGDVAQAFNLMAAHLEQTLRALQEDHAALERQSAHLENLLNSIEAVVLEADPHDCSFSYASREAENLLGFSCKNWLETGFFQRQVHPDDLPWVMDKIASRTHTPGSFTLDFRMLHRSGKPVWVRSISTYEAPGDNREHSTCLILMLDITEQKSNEERIIYLAEHDALTGLINRRRFQEELEKHIAYTERYGYEGALLFIDLDQFKYINDTFGHQAGDQYLVQVAQRLQKVLRKTDIMGRLGGDEFGVILPQSSREKVETVTRSLLDTLSGEELVYDSHTSHVSASIGINLFSAQNNNPNEILAQADTAMYAAKEAGRNRYHFFDEGDLHAQRMQSKVRWEERIRQALAQDRFVLHYQPVVNLQHNRISHYEVLLRMQDDEGGLIPPGAFIDTAEHFGLIRDIDLWVIKQAFKAQADTLLTRQPMHLAINLSGRNFGDKGFLNELTHALKASTADPSYLMFEVTETAAVENLAEARRFIEALRALGCRIALDDFGIGFSSFHYLKHLPVDYIKIDGSFVRNLHNDPTDRVFIKAIVEIAHGLGITTIAEFVESENVCSVLRSLHVDMGQGYYLGRPLAGFISAQELQKNIQASG